MTSDEQDEREPLGKDSPRGGEGLATGSAPQEGVGPDPDETVQDTARGGEGLATGSAPLEGVGPDPDETVKGTPRAGEGLAGDA
jgi:hypothetical protein